MTANLWISAGRTNLPQLRRRIISSCQRAQEIIARANSVPPPKMHALMLTYDKACGQMRADLAQASYCFSNIDEMLTWLFVRVGRGNHAGERSHGSGPRQPSGEGRN